MSIFLKTEDEIDLMREANQLVGATLAEVGKHIKEGGHDPSFDCFAHKFIRDHGAAPSFQNFQVLEIYFGEVPVPLSIMSLHMAFQTSKPFCERVTVDQSQCPFIRLK